MRALRRLGAAPERAPAPPGRRGRRIVGALVALALAAIAANVAGLELAPPWSRAGPALPGVRARAAEVVARFAPAAPPGQSPFFAVAPDGTLAVTDRQRHAVLRFSPDGRPLPTWGPRLDGGLVLADPAGIAAAGDEWLVLDRGGPQVVRLDAAGRPRGTIPLQQLQPYGPNGIALDAQGKLYVADTGRNRVLVFAPSRQLVGAFGAGGGELGQLKQPMALAAAPDGALFVADWENRRIERWDADLRPTGAWATPVRPWGVAVDRLGRVYVPGAELRRIEVRAPSGELLGELGGSGSAPIEVDAPSQVALGADGSTLYVLGLTAIVRLALEDVAPPAGAAGAPPFALPALALVALVGGAGHGRSSARLTPHGSAADCHTCQARSRSPSVMPSSSSSARLTWLIRCR